MAPTQVKKAEIADYLESQADELEQLARDDPQQRGAVQEMAARLAKVAREHELEVVAQRFDGLGPSSAKGAHSA